MCLLLISTMSNDRNSDGVIEVNVLPVILH